ncbi:MAG: hypothetical protein M3081_15290 [Gemmatimonadota bacterium]|nr:hypothetical protein [Gemmatimonadota bacterium]
MSTSAHDPAPASAPANAADSPGAGVLELDEADGVGFDEQHRRDERDGEGRRRDSVEIAYNGLEKPFTVTAGEAVQSLLNQAIAAFHVTTQPHLLALYNQAGVELPDAGTLGHLGVKPGDHLLMRPSAVKGG